MSILGAAILIFLVLLAMKWSGLAPEQLTWLGVFTPLLVLVAIVLVALIYHTGAAMARLKGKR